MPELKPLIAKIANGESLTRDEARDAFGILMSGAATPSQIGGFLMALRVRGETVDEISGAVATMRSKPATWCPARIAMNCDCPIRFALHVATIRASKSSKSSLNKWRAQGCARLACC